MGAFAVYKQGAEDRLYIARSQNALEMAYGRTPLAHQMERSKAMTFRLC
jgi:hypothetical protein